MGTLNDELVVPAGNSIGTAGSDGGDPPAHAEPLPALRDHIRTFSRDLRLTRHHLNRETAVPLGGLGVLTAIGRTPPGGLCRGKDLATACALDASTISRFVGALVERGLVERRPDPIDGRVAVLAVTPAGQRVLHEAEMWGEDLLTAVLASWSDSEVDVLVGSLGRFLSDLETELAQRSGNGRAPR
ncbi:MarR family winged helix-turn-helix transcriptional regulator [Cryptosporangium aurantiacum]|uniref:DNA-binding transcriptional regulator, MarR family n=1 Tax=Cryptosporangium aurantiacum TaxID=134849 RepID=A0A1M7PHB5_9ACTN|nr:MarR family winged helix-turn-helix transcriptional regulator [Cryptosporangium aurantiacum]SHN16482.1 DNA-binding transcriptional regulator, MarR family [Cryptosporangium aurantiacum]